MKDTREKNVMNHLPDGEESYFSLEELIRSDTAELNGIPNLPGDKELDALLNLTFGLLDPLRRLYGRPIRISSGYRCRRLNGLVGGVPDSQHLKGEAADCTATDCARLVEILKESKLAFDQAIWYKRRNFIHLSLSRKGNNRHQLIVNE